MKLEVLNKDFYYHIYNRGINREVIFETDENKRYFLLLYKKYLSDLISTFAYCLMDNHFHFLIRIDSDPKKVTQALSNLLNAYAKAFNKQQNRTGSLFEKHFKRIRLTDENYLRRLILYIHLNPKNHLGIDFENFKFSSYPAYFSDKQSVVKRNEIINLFDDLQNFRKVHRNSNFELEEKYSLE
ncbi:transposase [Salegentibacter sp. HM20]